MRRVQSNLEGMKNNTAHKIEIESMNNQQNCENTDYKSFNEFWPKYQQEHQHPLNRRLHFVGTNLALFLLISSALLLNPWFALAGVVSGYAFAWIGHFFVEKNRPLTFKYPWMSLKADFKAFVLTWKKIF